MNKRERFCTTKVFRGESEKVSEVFVFFSFYSTNSIIVCAKIFQGESQEKKKKKTTFTPTEFHTHKKRGEKVMFDGGVPADQFHQFIASRSSIPLPLSFPHNHHGVTIVSSSPPPPPITTTTFAGGCFESYPEGFFPPPPPPPHCHHHNPVAATAVNKVEEVVMVKEEGSRSVVSVSDGSVEEWSNDEVLALLRIRSWFPDFTWEHVSR